MNYTNIPLHQLTASPRNVRKTGGTSIDDLAASIRAHGLLQNLIVLPDGDKYAVIAGGRRLAALKRLAEVGDIKADHLVPCQLADDTTDGEISLAENVVREAMHPADQFEAFQRLVDTGMGVADVAARFGVPEVTVQKRLKLAKVSPKLIAVYREGGMDLEQLMAFTVTDDQGAQEKLWKATGDDHWRQRPEDIRRALTKAEISFEADAVAIFVGVDAFEAAGGTVRRDLFNEGGGYTTDRKLLNDLAMAKLQAKASELTAAGWAWAECRLKRDYDEMHGYRVVASSGYTTHGRLKYSKEAMAASGVIISIDSRGELHFDGGLLRKGDKAPTAAKAKATDKSTTKAKPEKRGLSAALLAKLDAQMTMALRAELVARPEIALRAIVHELALNLLYARQAVNGPVSLSVSSNVDLNRGDDTIATSLAGEAMTLHRKAWLGRIPRKQAELWPWLEAAPDVTVHQLLAYLTAERIAQSFTLSEKPVRIADYLEQSLGLDMRKWWKPTVHSYLGQVSRNEILAALKEAGCEAMIRAEGLETFKAKDLAKRAEQLLATFKEPWLPKLLRPIAAPAAKPKAAEQMSQAAKGLKAPKAKAGKAKQVKRKAVK